MCQLRVYNVREYVSLVSATCQLVYFGYETCLEMAGLHLVLASCAAACRGVTLRPRHLVVFRGRSRHTYGFEPAAFDLPHVELSSLVKSAQVKLTAAGDAQISSAASTHAELPVGDAQLSWIEGLTEAELSAAAGRAILVHGAFAVVSSAASVEAARAALGSGFELPDAGDFDVVDLGQPNLRREARSDLQARLRPSESARAETAAAATPSKQRSWVLLRERGGTVHLGWRVATGPAANRGAPGLRTGRRSYSGWLGRYALKTRESASPTAMEPEIAFLMANWAAVSAASRVLDPTCGSCGLLLSAAALGASALVGVDRNATSFAAVAQEFAHRSLPVPRLLHGDVLAPERTPELCAEASYDAILCDPPYNLRAPVLIDGAAHRPKDPQAAADRTPRAGYSGRQGPLAEGRDPQGLQGADQGAAPGHERRRPQPGRTAAGSRLGLGSAEGQPQLQVRPRAHRADRNL